VSGAALAAVLLTLLPELLRDPPSLWPWGVAGTAIIAALILALAPKKRGPLVTLVIVCVAWEALRWAARLMGLNLSAYRMILYALALIIMMIVRPQGLFGVREIWDYRPGSRRKRPAIEGAA
jgi:branched-chain amino acid transport system permease protein